MPHLACLPLPRTQPLPPCRALPVAVSLVAFVLPAAAQSHVPVEQGVADLGPLSQSLRVEQPDLRAPAGFDQVYRLHSPSGESFYARIGGGVVAVFPRSVYVPTRRGLLADIPPGTVFYIGGLPPVYNDQPGISALPPSPLLADTAVAPLAADLRLPLQATAPLPTPPPLPSLWTDETYRHHRLQRLLDLARRADQPSTRSPG